MAGGVARALRPRHGPGPRRSHSPSPRHNPDPAPTPPPWPPHHPTGSPAPTVAPASRSRAEGCTGSDDSREPTAD
ncbi:hypothetical protein Sgleb_31200 [Streptomyces glebosus]|uniref:Uncharacterized protein n=1 Tax=Streptomyces glebosus TaxID=249580 RepID=A0A640SUH3_9ACTN|nr:hypothetical protein Sgleb_31200 [Streptomyces glebosus]GHG61089.1 hypothetical protein GCM10010513_26920 [Streptomyces glebosus]